jgi:pimeloyl-ACP methyl ester carboxylesterase
MPLAATAQGALHYEVTDQAAPWHRGREAILFHHGIGASAAIWSGWFRRWSTLSAGRPSTCAAAAARTFPRPASPGRSTCMVDDLFAVADAAGLQRFHLVGESIGGTVALAAAIARPERIATLTVSNGAHLGASIRRVETWRSSSTRAA